MSGANSQQPLPAGIPALLPTGLCAGQPVLLLDRICVLVGSREGCDVFLVGGDVAPIHALLTTATSGVYLRNFGGRANVLVNGRPVLEYRLGHGDDVRIGQFTFQFSANQARFGPPVSPPPAALHGDTFTQIHGRSALVGSRAGCDVQLNDPTVADCHAILFASDSSWHLRDLDSPAGTFLNDARIRQAELQTGDRLTIGAVQLRFQPGESQPTAVQGIVLGGMPVALPEVAPPKGFGRVAVSFEGKSLASAIAPPSNFQTPTLPEIPSIESLGEAPESEAPLTPVLRRFPPVPKLKSRPAALNDPEFSDELSHDEDQPDFFASVASSDLSTPHTFSGGEEYVGAINDAVFGGQSLGGSDNYSVAEYPGNSDPQSQEIEDFSRNKFWDMSDEEGEVPLPIREKDFSPSIPPAVTEAASLEAVVDDSQPPADAESEISDQVLADSNGQADAATTSSQTLSSAASTSEIQTPPASFLSDRPPLRGSSASTLRAPLDAKILANYAQNGRKRTSRAVGAMMGLMGVSIAAAACGIIYLVPNHSTVEGRLSYLNAPAEGSDAWQALTQQQRQRLLDPDTAQLAAAHLSHEHTDITPGFLQSAGFESIASTAQFETLSPGAADLVLQVNGDGAQADSLRLASLLQAVYQKDSDLTTAAAAARSALSDWEPNITGKEGEVAASQRRIDDQQKIIDSAKDLGGQVDGLRAAVDSAVQTYGAALLSLQTDQYKLTEIEARLSARAAESPSTQPIADELNDLQGRIKEAGDQVTALQAAIGDNTAEKTKETLTALRQKLDQSRLAAQDIFQTHPDFKSVMDMTFALIARAGDLTDQLVARRQNFEERFEKLKRFIDHTARARDQLIFDRDESLIRMNDDLKVARQQFFAAQAAAEASTPSTQPSAGLPVAVDADALVQLRERRDAIQERIHIRQRALAPDDTAIVSERLNRLIDDGRSQLAHDRQVVEDTLQTLGAEMSAAPPVTGITEAQRRTGTRLVQGISDVAHSQSVYVAAVAAEAESASQALLSTREQLDDLTARADAQRRFLAAATQPALGDELAQLTSTRDQLAARVAAEWPALETAAAAFLDRAMVDLNTELKLQAARAAQASIAALTQSHDAKVSDLNAMKQNREELSQRVKTTVDVRRPTAADSVKIISDNSNAKLEYAAAAALAIGLFFAALTWLIAGRRSGGKLTHTPVVPLGAS